MNEKAGLPFVGHLIYDGTAVRSAVASAESIARNAKEVLELYSRPSMALGRRTKYDKFILGIEPSINKFISEVSVHPGRAPWMARAEISTR